MYGNELEESLKGKIVESVDSSLYGVTFHTTTGDVEWRVEGDCCSYSWIENADLELVKGEVYSVSEDPLDNYPPAQKREDIDYEADYGVTIRSAGGTGTIDYRNDSNGYYGGYMIVVKP